MKQRDSKYGLLLSQTGLVGFILVLAKLMPFLIIYYFVYTNNVSFFLVFLPFLVILSREIKVYGKKWALFSISLFGPKPEDILANQHCVGAIVNVIVSDNAMHLFCCCPAIETYIINNGGP